MKWRERPGVKQQEEAEPVPEQTEECMLTEIRSDVLQEVPEKEAAGKTESGKAADQSKPKSAGESCAGTKAETSVE